MKTFTFGFGILLTLFLFQGNTNQKFKNNGQVLYKPEDKEIVGRILVQFSGERNSETGDLMIKIAELFMGTPYVAHTLETGVDEKLVINLRELDCTTLAENVLALARTIKSGNRDFEGFVTEMERIRYRRGHRDGYLSRLHYFSDWIFDNNEKGIVKEVAGEIAQVMYPNRVDFMSKHPDSYQVLKTNPGLIELLKVHESAISDRTVWYIPKESIQEIENQLRDGDIVALTTSIAGLDVTHVGLVAWKDGRTRLIHASSKEMKVVLTNETLVEYLKNSKSTTGIMVARPM